MNKHVDIGDIEWILERVAGVKFIDQLERGRYLAVVQWQDMTFGKIDGRTLERCILNIRNELILRGQF